MSEAITVGSVLAILGVLGAILVVGFFAYIILKAIGAGWSH